MGVGAPFAHSPPFLSRQLATFCANFSLAPSLIGRFPLTHRVPLNHGPLLSFVSPFVVPLRAGGPVRARAPLVNFGRANVRTARAIRSTQAGTWTVQSPPGTVGWPASRGSPAASDSDERWSQPPLLSRSVYTEAARSTVAHTSARLPRTSTLPPSLEVQTLTRCTSINPVIRAYRAHAWEWAHPHADAGG